MNEAAHTIIDLVDIGFLLGFLLVCGAMAYTMIVHAYGKHGQPLQYAGWPKWDARMAWSTSLFVFGVWVGAFVRMVDMYLNGHDTSVPVMVSDGVRLFFAILMYVAWRSWSKTV